jgi:5-methylcytosine-specific restriction endonuclease McrA
VSRGTPAERVSRATLLPFPRPTLITSEYEYLVDSIAGLLQYIFVLVEVSTQWLRSAFPTATTPPTAKLFAAMTTDNAARATCLRALHMCPQLTTSHGFTCEFCRRKISFALLQSREDTTQHACLSCAPVCVELDIRPDHTWAIHLVEGDSTTLETLSHYIQYMDITLTLNINTPDPEC